MDSVPSSPLVTAKFAAGPAGRLAYVDVGEGTPTVVLVHGGFANRSHYAGQIEHLSRRHRVIALDLRGHGESDAPQQGFGLSDFAADVAAVCRAAGVERAVLCGHSFPVALEVAAASSALAAGVVLLDGVILMSEQRRHQVLSTLVPALEGDGWLEALKGYFARFVGPTTRQS